MREKGQVTYDKDVDILSISLDNGTPHDSDEIAPGVIVDYAEDGRILSVEIMDALKRLRE